MKSEKLDSDDEDFSKENSKSEDTKWLKSFEIKRNNLVAKLGFLAIC